MAIENSSPDAMFTEVLQISIDVDQFNTDLAVIQSEWEDAVLKMGQTAREAGLDPSDLLNSTAFAANVQNIEEQMQELSAATGETFGAMANALTDTMERVERVAARAAEQVERVKSAGAPAGSSSSSGHHGFFGNTDLLDSIAMVTKWLLLWRLVGEAIDGVVAAAEVLPHAFENGVKYLTDLQDNAVKLRGTIAANVQFSKDLGENFRIAGGAAEYVVKQLQDVAAKTQIPFDQLTMAFRALLQGGGASMTTDMQQLVQLTEMFALAMQASGRDVMATRSLISELPKLLNGSATASSKLLEVLHLTLPQWERIRQEALKHHDLLAQLEPIMRPYLSAVEDAAFRHTVLSAQLKLNKERVEAAFATPVLKKWNELLADVNSWLTKNDTATNTLASDTGRLAVSIANLFTGQTADGLHSIVVALDAFINGLNVLVTVLGVAKRELVDFDAVAPLTEKVLKAGSDILHGHFSAAGADVSDIKAYVKGQYQKDVKEILDSVAEAESSLGQVMYGTGAAENKFPFQSGKTGINPNAGKEALAKLKEQFTEERDAIREHTQQTVQDISQAMTDRKLSIEEGSNQIIAAYKAEAEKIKVVAEKFEKAATLTGDKPDKITKFQTSIRNAADTLTEAANKAESAAHEKASKDQQAIEAEKNRSIEALAVQHERTMLAILKQQAAEGLATHQQVAQAEIALANATYEAQAKAIEQQLQDAGANALLQEKAQDALKLLNAKHQEEQQKNNQDLSEARLKDQTERLKQQTDGIRLSEEENKYLYRGASLAEKQLQLQKEKLDVAKEYVKLLAENGIRGERMDAAQLAAERAQLEYNQARSADAFFPHKYDSESGQALGVDYVKSAQNLKNVFDELGATVKNVIAAYRSGGALGAAGAAASNVGGILEQAGTSGTAMSSLFGALGIGSAALGPIGAGIGLAGDVISTISSIFQQAAKQIAYNVKQAFDQIINAYQYQNQTLVQTIKLVQQEQQQAIDQLSGVKGGEKELQQLLPMFQKELEQLEQTREKTVVDFQKNVYDLQTTVTNGNDVMAKSFDEWTQTFKKAKDALGAGVSPTDVRNFLNLTLKQQEVDLQTQLNQGEQQAIQDNFKLNDLTLQREELMLKIQQMNFSAQDSIERRQAGAIGEGIQLKLQREQMQNQLDTINEQISVQQHRVGVENQIYGITNDIASLHKLDAQLQEQAIDRQLSQYQTMKTLLESLLPLSAQIFGPGKVGFAGHGALVLRALVGCRE